MDFSLTVLFIGWGFFLTLVLIDWTQSFIERRKLSKMSQIKRIEYLQQKYGKNWMDKFDA